MCLRIESQNNIFKKYKEILLIKNEFKKTAILLTSTIYENFFKCSLFLFISIIRSSYTDFGMQIYI